MERHLFLTGQTELHGSLVALNSMQARLRENQETGLIEVKVGTTRQIVLAYANGTQVGVYLLENGQSRPFNLAEISTLWGGAPFSVCSVPLPDRAGRAIWLILESHKREQLEIHGEEAWIEQLKLWEQEKFDGAVEITSKNSQGFAVLQKGHLIADEAMFFNGQRFENELPPGIGAYGNWQLITYAAMPLSGAWKCLNLRGSAICWAKGTLNRYQSIAGQRFLQVTSREIGMLIQPWQWKINLSGETVSDEHFFAGTEAAAHAYRALFMGMGTQMSFVIGGSLTLRILTEIFEELEKDQRAALEAHRLIPAAFSN
ncbi:MAG TPA: hypothetical protein VLM78_01370 [Anaerolineales bacterium]|nr:hypothetical protein [Anaerolineales bacterium]